MAEGRHRSVARRLEGGLTSQLALVVLTWVAFVVVVLLAQGPQGRWSGVDHGARALLDHVEREVAHLDVGVLACVAKDLEASSRVGLCVANRMPLVVPSLGQMSLRPELGECEDIGRRRSSFRPRPE